MLLQKYYMKKIVIIISLNYLLTFYNYCKAINIDEINMYPCIQDIEYKFSINPNLNVPIINIDIPIIKVCIIVIVSLYKGSVIL